MRTLFEIDRMNAMRALPPDLRRAFTGLALKLLVAARIELDAAAARPTASCDEAHRSLERIVCCGAGDQSVPLWSEWARSAFAAFASVGLDPCEIYGDIACGLRPWTGKLDR